MANQASVDDTKTAMFALELRNKDLIVLFLILSISVLFAHERFYSASSSFGGKAGLSSTPSTFNALA